MDFVNLGFSGNGKGEPEMAKYIAGMNMSALVMDYDQNATTVEHLENTHYNFYQIVRESNPDLPIILLSSPCAIRGEAYYTKVHDSWGHLKSDAQL